MHMNDSDLREPCEKHVHVAIVCCPGEVPRIVVDTPTITRVLAASLAILTCDKLQPKAVLIPRSSAPFSLSILFHNPNTNTTDLHPQTLTQTTSTYLFRFSINHQTKRYYSIMSSAEAKPEVNFTVRDLELFALCVQCLKGGEFAVGSSYIRKRSKALKDLSGRLPETC